MRKKYRMSGIVVFIGYILLIPSILGVLTGLLISVGSGAGGASVLVQMKEDTRRTLQTASVPAPLIEKVVSLQPVQDAELASLSDSQKQAVTESQAHMVGGTAGAGIVGAAGVGAGIAFAIMCLVSGLVGWLLVMKKRVLQCTNCGAVIAAS
jgi:hypothetical protein